ncbi:MAG: type II toxin-antitoxin system ParD family antitoxin [Thermodesulfobacteriota bacterium]
MTTGEDVRDDLGDRPRPEPRLPEESEIKLCALRRALEEGETSGVADYYLSGLIRELDEESIME